MTKKIFYAVFVVAAAVTVLCIAIIVGCLYPYFGAIQEERLRDDLLLAAEGVEENGVEYLDSLDNIQCRLTLAAQDGTILYDSESDPATMENHADREEIAAARENGTGMSVRYSATLLEKTIYYARLLSDGSVLRISVSQNTVWVLLLGMAQPIVVVLVGALILSAVLSSRLSRKIVEPLNRMDIDSTIESPIYDELRPLVTRINQQQRQINSQLHELQRQRGEFTQITANMKEGLILLGEKGVVLNINPAASGLFNTSSACIGKDFMTIERDSAVTETINKALETGHSETRLLRGCREYQLDVSRIESELGAVGEVLLSFDVTESAANERMRREFTANVSHELKTPLQSIMGSAELMENGLVKSEDIPKFVGHIRTQAQRLLTLIEDIIRLSQLDEGGELNFENVDLLEVVRENVKSLETAANDKNVTVKVTGGSVTVVSVRRLLGEIVYNLCDNAIKYNIDGGSVNILIASDGITASITVNDTGIGIPKEQLDRVFERFYRADKSRSGKTSGTGLGLSIVKHAVSDIGGSIELKSEVGVGTSVTVRVGVNNLREAPLAQSENGTVPKL